jgi:hypothetical protein
MEDRIPKGKIPSLGLRVTGWVRFAHHTCTTCIVYINMVYLEVGTKLLVPDLPVPQFRM